MAVLVEAISVIVRLDSVNRKFSGGWSNFLSIVPNNTYCCDDELIRVGFMSPQDTQSFVLSLEQSGLIFLKDGIAVDLAVVDQMRGPTMPAPWLEFARLSLAGTENRVGACWLYEGPRVAAGIHMRSENMNLITPEDWTYEESLSANSRFVESAHIHEELKFLRHENGIDIYVDRLTGKEVYEATNRSL